MELAVFITFACLAVVSALVVVTHPNPVYATMSLVVTLFATAVLFALLGAPFLAALQLLLYTGAILVLFLFVLMLLNVGRERADGRRSPALNWTAVAVAAIFFASLASLIVAAQPSSTPPLAPPPLGRIAAELFSTYLLPFEMIGLLLLVAVIGATIIARRAETPPREGER